jgi:hypothetical protein
VTLAQSFLYLVPGDFLSELRFSVVGYRHMGPAPRGPTRSDDGRGQSTAEEPIPSYLGMFLQEKIVWLAGLLLFTSCRACAIIFLRKRNLSTLIATLTKFYICVTS